MPKLTIDGREIEVPDGATILQAARRLGIDIPTLCYLEGRDEPHAACMVCVVKVNGNPNMVPSCARRCEEGMEVESETEEVITARRSAVELILSDHIGDCEGPCENTCPAHMQIPQMMRDVAEGDIAKAMATVKRDIALPAVLGRICPEVCEKTCRRQVVDTPVSICLVKRYVGDGGEAGAIGDQPQVAEAGPDSGKRVVVVGAGPAGLAAAFYLRLDGHAVTVIDRGQAPGGTLRSDVDEDKLPRPALDAEIAVIKGLGVDWRFGISVGSAPSVADLRQEFDAVFLAIGHTDADGMQALGLKLRGTKPAVDVNTLSTGIDGVFAGGDLVRQRKLAIRSVADGKIAARAIGQYLAGVPITGEAKRFNSRTGKVNLGEAVMLVPGKANEDGRLTPAGDGYSGVEVTAEATRCLHCDCVARDDCHLRDLADRLQAKQNHFTGSRRAIQPIQIGPELVYEPGKCISCGKCVYISQQAGEDIGLALTNRGFELEVSVPFARPFASSVKKVAGECVRNCPTGALSMRADYGFVASLEE